MGDPENIKNKELDKISKKIEKMPDSKQKSDILRDIERKKKGDIKK